MSVSIIVDILKSTYFGGERVEGNLVVKASSAVSIPGIVINAGSRTRLTQGTQEDEEDHASNARVAEPYKQQLRVAMPRNGEKGISLAAGSTTNYPFALILPPDLFPSYYCKSKREEDGTCYVASLTYQLVGDVAHECGGVSVTSEPSTIQIVPVALPYGPQPRKGYIIPVFDGMSGDDEEEEEEEEVNAGAGAPKKEKSKAGCMGGGGSASKTDAKSATDRSRGAAKPKQGVTPAGTVKVALTMQTAYICLPPNDEHVRVDKSAAGANTLWVEVKLSNQMREAQLPFQMRMTLKLVTVYKPTNGEEPVQNVITLASRTARAVLPSNPDGETLILKPGESTPMRLSLTVPQQLALSECEAIPILPQDGSKASRRPVTAPVPPTVETSTFDARTMLEVNFTTLEGKTKDDDHIIVLEDPVEVVGVPSSE